MLLLPVGSSSIAFDGPEFDSLVLASTDEGVFIVHTGDRSNTVGMTFK